MSECIYCNKAILTQDGALRCDKDLSLAKEMCDEIDYGKFKVLKVEIVRTKRTYRRKK